MTPKEEAVTIKLAEDTVYAFLRVAEAVQKGKTRSETLDIIDECSESLATHLSIAAIELEEFPDDYEN